MGAKASKEILAGLEGMPAKEARQTIVEMLLR
jgi:hypothetical protein